MVASESGLCAAMKKEYKEAGYKVAGLVSDGEDKILIAAPGWCVVILKEKVPRRVLGLIVEHVGDIPRAEEAYQVQKKQVQTEIHGVTTQILEKLLDPKLERRQVKPTSLRWGRYILCQRLDDLKIVKVDPDTGAIMYAAPRMDMLGEEILTVSGIASDVYIDISATLHEETAQMDHLSQMQWV